MRVKDTEKERLIREKAIEMIVNEGFDGLSMQKLAKAADVSPATIYLYFTNREDLLNQLFMECEQNFFSNSLKNFDPEMNFEEGLWLQWKNRYDLILADPLRFHFMEQFRNSPLIKHECVRRASFKEEMGKFVHNAIKKNQLKKLPLETYWALAYGPLYTLIKFHLQEKPFGEPFNLTPAKLKQAFQLVIKSLQP